MKKLLLIAFGILFAASAALFAAEQMHGMVRLSMRGHSSSHAAAAARARSAER